MGGWCKYLFKVVFKFSSETLLCLGMFLLYPICLGFLLWKNVVFCQIVFLHLLRWSCDFIFYFINMFIDFLTLNHPYIQGINPTWLLCIILFNCSWIQFADTLSRLSVPIFIRDVGSIVLISCGVICFVGRYIYHFYFFLDSAYKQYHVIFDLASLSLILYRPINIMQMALFHAF